MTLTVAIRVKYLFEVGHVAGTEAKIVIAEAWRTAERLVSKRLAILIDEAVSR
jgi:hypothetical protein